ncbi:lysozyme inhibitor LprI family protein [Pararobbsia silviterrae]|uniref:lysozyme inhibitor LprI family protein n=1 Tax=Pararobbsia silviterrae TaxID=1792498 RepID=UPI001314B31F|nr:lysozyme inhibitor LprI family protein [Pararobbsia silviterrae]
MKVWIARPLRWILFVLLGAAAVEAPSAQNPPTSGPSFSCESTNTSVEATICGDAALAERDRTMAILFAGSRKDVFGIGASRQTMRQRAWLKARNAQCARGHTRACLIAMYDDRLRELAVAALFQTPDVALKELARQDPKSASLYEAIYRYSTIDDPVERANIVSKLIDPAFNELAGKPWATPLRDIADSHEAASSDERFATFLDVASASDVVLTMPCAALLRRPGLIDALKPVYGSAMDSHLIRSDCQSMTSSLPVVDRLTEAVVAVQPSCPGTIRFSLGRAFDKTLVTIRLYGADVATTQRLDLDRKPESTDDPADDEDVAHFVATHRALIREATDELTQYYADRFDETPARIKAEALDGISAIILGAYDLCERG